MENELIYWFCPQCARMFCELRKSPFNGNYSCNFCLQSFPSNILDIFKMIKVKEGKENGVIPFYKDHYLEKQFIEDIDSFNEEETHLGRS